MPTIIERTIRLAAQFGAIDDVYFSHAIPRNPSCWPASSLGAQALEPQAVANDEGFDRRYVRSELEIPTEASDRLLLSRVHDVRGAARDDHDFMLVRVQQHRFALAVAPL